MKPALLAALATAMFCCPVSIASAAGQNRPAGGAAASSMATLRPGDVLRIRVWPDTALGGEFPVEETGHVYLPLLGQMLVTGRGLEDIRRDVRARYAQTMSNPVVTIVPSFRVSVIGAVVRPGTYQVDPTHSPFDVISLAGGFAPRANQREIRLVRDGQSIMLDVETMLAAQTAESLQLRSGDRILVDERRSIRGT